MHQGTLDDFPDFKNPAGEWRTVWIPWFKRLPIFLDLGGLRAVHACWHPQHIARLAGRTLEDDDFLHAAADKATPEGEAIEAVLKGIEVPLPVPQGYLRREQPNVGLLKSLKREVEALCETWLNAKHEALCASFLKGRAGSPRRQGPPLPI
jgi:hypothetical protein